MKSATFESLAASMASVSRQDKTQVRSPAMALRIMPAGAIVGELRRETCFRIPSLALNIRPATAFVDGLLIDFGAAFAKIPSRQHTHSDRASARQFTSAEHRTMTVLDRLYSLEIEFHRRFRSEAINAIEAWSVHTSYALQNGYEPLLRTIGTVDSASLAKAKDRMIAMSDPRDVQAAFHSLQRLIIVD